jgi:hypothetical protein
MEVEETDHMSKRRVLCVEFEKLSLNEIRPAVVVQQKKPLRRFKKDTDEIALEVVQGYDFSSRVLAYLTGSDFMDSAFLL